MAFGFGIFNSLWGLGSLAVGAVQAVWEHIDKHDENSPKARDAAPDAGQHVNIEELTIRGNLSPSQLDAFMQDPVLARLCGPKTPATFKQEEQGKQKLEKQNKQPHEKQDKQKCEKQDKETGKKQDKQDSRKGQKSSSGSDSAIDKSCPVSCSRKHTKVKTEVIFIKVKDENLDKPWTWLSGRQLEGYLEDPLIGPELRKWREEHNMGSPAKQDTHAKTDPAIYTENLLIGPELRRWELQDSPIPFGQNDARTKRDAAIDMDYPQAPFATQCQRPYGEEDSWSDPESFHDFCARRDSTPKQEHSNEEIAKRKRHLEEERAALRAYQLQLQEHPDDEAAKRKRHLENERAALRAYQRQMQEDLDEEAAKRKRHLERERAALRAYKRQLQEYTEDEAAKRRRYLEKERAALRAYQRQMQIRADAAREHKSHTTLREQKRQWEDVSRIDREGHMVVRREARHARLRERMKVDPTRKLQVCTWHKIKTEPEKRGGKCDVPTIKLTDPEGEDWFLQDLRYYPDEDYDEVADEEDDSDEYVYGNASDEEGAC
ncbi:hypothetical protein NEMBOFW57_002180 [Staphylotrichum longicolle]|uniref:Uncharacterized protein n=1 Tax=Staphylotrichum longicolle TaxID=669026 RepID=A0AAD4F3S9_9PEZI|nr:hypothetical protein NEMBOFW57_002180 [Staphylotrichum longicolle]